MTARKCSKVLEYCSKYLLLGSKTARNICCSARLGSARILFETELLENARLGFQIPCSKSPNEYHFLFTCPAYAHLRNKFFDHFRYIRITRGLISSVTDFLAFIPPNVIVSIILAFNKFRLSIKFPSVI